MLYGIRRDVGRHAEGLGRICQDGDLTLEVVSLEGGWNEGVDDGEAEVPVLIFISP